MFRFIVFCSLLVVVFLAKEKSKKKKSLSDYSDDEIDALFDQWEENENETDPDDYAQLKPPAQQPNVMFDPTKPIKNVEDVLKQSKKGQTVMLFAQVTGHPDRSRGEAVSARWQSSLFNANIHTQRYMLDDMRAIFVVQDGSLAWDVKDFLVTQNDCASVELEQKTYWGPGASKQEVRESEQKQKKEDEMKAEAMKKMAQMKDRNEL